MRLLAQIAFFLVLAFPSFGQTVGGAGWCKTSANPNTITSLRVVNQRNMCSNVWDTLARKMYYYDYTLTVGSRWVEFVPLGPPIGAETKVEAGTGISVAGNGTIATPYIITNTGDLSNTNELQYVDTLLYSGDTLRLSLSLDGRPQKKVYIPTPPGGIYGISDTTTGNHIATIAADRTLTFRAQDDDAGGIVPFRVTSTGSEPEIMGLYANGDSLVFGKSDTELTAISSTGLTIMAANTLALIGDSVVVQNLPTAQSTEKTYVVQGTDAYLRTREGIPLSHLTQSGATTGQGMGWSGTAWVPVDPEIASVATVADSAAFRAFSASADVIIMSDRDRGGKFRKCTSCTADQYMVFTDATAQKWVRFDFGDAVKPEYFGATQENNNDTRGWKLALRYAENNPVSVLLPRGYQVKDSILLQKKVVIEGLNVRNQTSTLSFVEFDIPGSVSAIYFTPLEEQSQGPLFSNLSFRDISASGNRHCIEFYAEIADAKGATYTKIENCNFENFDRYAVYVNDCYMSAFDMNMIGVQSGGGVLGVDMSGTKLVTQSQGDTWTVANINMGGTLPDVLVAGDTAFIDVRDVGNVKLSNITLQGSVGTGIAKQLIWADFGNVQIDLVYSELSGAGALSNLGRFGSTDNPNCSVDIHGLYFALGAAYATKTFNVYGATTVRAEDVEFGSGSPATLFTVRGGVPRNIEIKNFVKDDRPLWADFDGYRNPLSLQGTQQDLVLEYPHTDIIWSLPKDTIGGPTRVGPIVHGGGVYTQVFDTEKGRVGKFTTTSNRAYFTLDLQLPPKFRGRPIVVTMTYKFSIADSTGGGPNRYAISDALSGQYVSTAPLRLNRWAVATDVFFYPLATSTTQLVFGDAGGAFTSGDCEFSVHDITIRYGNVLEAEKPGIDSTNRLTFRSNISGANVGGFLNGDLVSTPSGVYIKKAGAFSLIDDIASDDVTGSATAGQVAFWDGTKVISGENNLWWDKTNNRLGVNTSTPGYALEAVGQTVVGTYGLINPDFGEMTVGHKDLSPFIEKFAFTQNSSGNTVFNGLDLYFRTGNVTRAYMTSGGNFGINETSPSQKLHVSGNARITGAIYDSSNDPGSSGEILKTTVTGTDWVSASTLGDNWGSQVVMTTGSTLDGNGTAGAPLKVNTGGIGATELSSLGTAGTYGSATQVPVITLDADGRASGVTNTTITGTLSGLTATRIPFASAANALTDDNRLRWDNTNKRLSVGDTGGSPSASVHIAEGSVASWEPLKAVGTVSGNMITTLSNTQNSGGASNNLVDLSVGGASAGDPAYRLLVNGVNTWVAAGIDNSAGDLLKIGPGTTPSSMSNVGITMTADATPLIGINNDTPLHPLHVIGRATATVLQGISGTPTHTFGAGAGTGPTLGTLTGCTNGFNLQITIGTTPTVGGNIVSVTFPTSFSNLSFPTYSCGNDQTALENAAGKFVISAASATALTIKHNALTAALTAGDVLFFRFNTSGR